MQAPPLPFLLSPHHHTGVFVISPGAEPEVLYTFRENDNALTEFADNAAILAALPASK